MIDFKAHFDFVTKFILNELMSDEEAAITYNAEDSYFMRFKEALVRQNGTVEQASIYVKIWKQQKSFGFNVGLHFDQELDVQEISNALQQAREKIMLLPEDPYYAPPTASEKSKVVFKGSLLEPDSIPYTVLTPFKGYNFTGLYTQGKICEGVVNTKGANHWFETETFILDYSVWLKNGRAVKSSYAGKKFNINEYQKKAKENIKNLAILDSEPKKLEPGKYRAFITADALSALTNFLHGFGERSLRQGSSAFIALKEGRETFSKEFNLSQDFSLGLDSPFNSNGELSPEKIDIISKGELKNTLVSSRSAAQYKLKSNAASAGEHTRSISIKGGKLKEKDILKELGTGIYISNFHYLNWSDPAVARVTGMTRFACLWVENGKVIGPIADLRWDESLYNIFGANLLGITSECKSVPDDGTYGGRRTGGCSIPGILVKDFNCTL
ncbi:MAG: hypothetical protein CR988_07895 [Treponema sp.]|nr:MAG: hypothetical protein CR988_07895 [Treponema sp.]